MGGKETRSHPERCRATLCRAHLSPSLCPSTGPLYNSRETKVCCEARVRLVSLPGKKSC